MEYILDCNTKLEKIEVENIPICSFCLFEIQNGNFICNDCKINLCSFHFDIHEKQNYLHEFMELIKK